MRRAFYLLTLFVASSPAIALAQSVEDRARSAATASRSRTSQSDALQDNLLTPGFAGQPISTIDGSASFSPSLACQKSATMLEILVQPGSSGDLSQVRISHDRDVDGQIDSQTILPNAISGICANGVISCTAGTWQGCSYHKWAVGTDQAIALLPVFMTELAGCYCLNNSCGTNLAWTNMAGVLKDLGGGIIGALTTADPRIGVAQAKVDGPLIQYVGAQTTACATNASVSQTQYAVSPASLAGDAASVSDSSSIFQALKASSAGLGSAEQSISCSITREITQSQASADDIIRRSAGGYATVMSGTERISFQMGAPKDNGLKGGSCTLFDFRMSLDVADVSRLKAVRLARYFADDWAQIRVDGALIASGPTQWAGTGLPPGKCERKAVYDVSPALDLTPYMSAGSHEIWLRVAVGDEGEAFAQIDADLDLGCRSTERLVDLCAGTASQSQCTLKDESVDGVVTFRNGVSTGLSPLTQTRTMGTGACAVTISRDFFERHRRYACTIDAGTSHAPDLTRSAYIIDHSTETLLADRARKSDGSFDTSTRPFTMPDRGTVAACEPICKTRKARINADAAPDGVTGALQNAPAGWDVFYHGCSTDNVCPAGDGEEILSACGCLDDFPEAVSMMQTVRLAGADLVCTATTP